jgi:hypothetical protein
MTKGLPRSLARNAQRVDIENVAALTGTLTGTVDGVLVDVAATASAVVGGATPTAAQVDTGIALAVSTIVTGVNTQNKELMTKLNEILAALKALA